MSFSAFNVARKLDAKFSISEIWNSYGDENLSRSWRKNSYNNKTKDNRSSGAKQFMHKYVLISKHGDHSLSWVNMKMTHSHGQVTSNLIKHTAKNKNRYYSLHPISPFHTTKITLTYLKLKKMHFLPILH